MSTFTYLVTVETERDSGLIASRDEQSESIVNEIESAVNGHQISGIGARSDSEYSVVEVDIAEYDKRSLKAELAQYDAAVLAAEPSNADLKAELRAAKAEAAAANTRAATAERKLAKVTAEREITSSRIWQGRGSGDEARVYLADGRYDHVYFQMGEADETLSIRFDEGDLEIRYNGMGSELLTLPRSGNEIAIRTQRRVARNG